MCFRVHWRIHQITIQNKEIDHVNIALSTFKDIKFFWMFLQFLNRVIEVKLSQEMTASNVALHNLSSTFLRRQKEGRMKMKQDQWDQKLD